MASKVAVELEELNPSDSATHDQKYTSSDSHENEEHDRKDSDSNEVEFTLHPHGEPKELPGGVFHSIRFTEDASPISKWLQSPREKRQHVDDYTCTAYVSFNISVSRMTALHLACLYNRLDAIKILLQAGADVAVTDGWGRNALHCLCSSKSEKTIFKAFNVIMPRVLERERNHEVVNVRDRKHGRTPLLEACLMNRKHAVTSLVQSSLVADVNVIDSAQMTPLHCVCASPNQDEDVEPLFDFILEFSQRNLTARDNNGRTPFLVACEYNKPSIAKKLLEAGSDVYAQDHDHQTALHYLSASKSENIEELLRIITKRVTKYAKIGGDFHFRSTENLDHVDAPTSMALHFINKKDARGLTPFQVALSHKNRCIKNAKILISKGANVHVTLDDGRWPLQYACNTKDLQIELAIKLIQSGADISVLIDGSPLLHFACRENLVQLVDCLLKHGADVSQKNDLQKKPIYYVQSNEVHKLLVKAGAIDYGYRDLDLLNESCRKGYTDRAVYLIKHMKKEFIQAKHLKWAVKYNYKYIAMALVKHPHWYQFLRYSEPRENGIPTTPFRELIRKMPDVAEVVLDRCIVANPEFKDPGDPNFTVLMNYEFLDDFAISMKRPEDGNDDVLKANLMRKRRTKAEVDIPVYQGHDCSYEKLQEIDPPTEFSTKWGPVHFSRSNHPLSIMVKHGRENLLTHPVVGSLLHHKWHTFGQYGYYTNLLTYCLFVLFLNLYALLLKDPISDECIAVRNQTQNATIDCDLTSAKAVFLYVAASLVIVMVVFRFSHEASQVVQTHNFIVLNHAIKVILYITSILFVIVYGAECQCIARWQWQCGVVAVFLSWLNLIIFTAKFPLTGIYVIMLIRVFYTFMKVVLLASLLVIAFGISFYMAFNEPLLSRSPFSTHARSLLKLVTMTTGEFEFDNIFRQAPNGDSDGEPEIPFEAVSYIIWIIFIVVMPVLLTNMLVGLAVGDIDRIQKAASLEKLALQVTQVLAVEKSLRKRPCGKLHTIAWKKIYPNSNITSTHTLELLKERKKTRIWKKFLFELGFAIWGGERYDTLKSIRDRLAKTKLHVFDSPDSNSDTSANASAEVEELYQRLQNMEKQNADLVLEVRNSREELKNVYEVVQQIAKEILPPPPAPSPPPAPPPPPMWYEVASCDPSHPTPDLASFLSAITSSPPAPSASQPQVSSSLPPSLVATTASVRDRAKARARARIRATPSRFLSSASLPLLSPTSSPPTSDLPVPVSSPSSPTLTAPTSPPSKSSASQLSTTPIDSGTAPPAASAPSPSYPTSTNISSYPLVPDLPALVSSRSASPPLTTSILSTLDSTIDLATASPSMSPPLSYPTLPQQ